MTDSLAGDVFARELTALRNRYHTKQHSIFDRWVARDLTKIQMGRDMAQYFQLVREILRPFGVAEAKAPRDVQQMLIENLAEEHGGSNTACNTAPKRFTGLKNTMRPTRNTGSEPLISWSNMWITNH